MSKTLERARLVREDCATDAAIIDRTPFTPQAIGPVFGNILAMIAALAKCIEELASSQRLAGAHPDDGADDATGDDTDATVVVPVDFEPPGNSAMHPSHRP